jgi:cytochrome c peroxidase
MNVAALMLLSADTTQRIATFVLDDQNRGAANPYAVAWSPDGSFLCVAHAGTHELSVIDFRALEEKLSRSASDDVIADFGFLKGIRTRVKLPGNGPRSLTIASGSAYVGEYFSDSISVVNLGTGTLTKITSLPQSALEQPEREGEQVFNDATICHQSWQSCATCHPDGRADGLNWDLLNDGIGNPKNTKSLVLAAQTQPSMSLAERPNIQAAIRAGFRHILFSLPSEKNLTAVTAYLSSLKPVDSPFLVRGQLSSSAARGERLFRSIGCIECHPQGLFTDLHTHSVGTAAPPADKLSDRFDTPSLVELWRTAPYLHDGSAGTVEDIITTSNHDDKHGATHHLSESELHELTAFLQSL